MSARFGAFGSNSLCRLREHVSSQCSAVYAAREVLDVPDQPCKWKRNKEKTEKHCNDDLDRQLDTECKQRLAKLPTARLGNEVSRSSDEEHQDSEVRNKEACLLEDALEGRSSRPRWLGPSTGVGATHRSSIVAARRRILCAELVQALRCPSPSNAPLNVLTTTLQVLAERPEAIEVIQLTHMSSLR